MLFFLQIHSYLRRPMSPEGTRESAYPILVLMWCVRRRWNQQVQMPRKPGMRRFLARFLITQIEQVSQPSRRPLLGRVNPPYRHSRSRSIVNNIRSPTTPVARLTIPNRNQQITMPNYKSSHHFICVLRIDINSVVGVRRSASIQRDLRVSTIQQLMKLAQVFLGRKRRFFRMMIVPPREVALVLMLSKGHWHAKFVAVLQGNFRREPVASLGQGRNEIHVWVKLFILLFLIKRRHHLLVRQPLHLRLRPYDHMLKLALDPCNLVSSQTPCAGNA